MSSQSAETAEVCACGHEKSQHYALGYSGCHRPCDCRLIFVHRAESDAVYDNPVDDDGGRVPLFDPPICLCGLVTGACPAHPFGITTRPAQTGADQ